MSQAFTQRERILLKDMAALSTARARDEAALAERARVDRRSADREQQEALAAAEDAHAHETAAIEARLREQLASDRARYDAEIAAGRRRMEARLRAFGRRTAMMEGAASTTLRDSTWLVETVVESGEVKIRQDFEAARINIDAGKAQFNSFRGAAAILLEQYGHPPLSADPADPGPLPQGVAALLAAFVEKRNEASRLLAALHRVVRPPMLRPRPVILLSLLAAAAGGAAAWRFYPQEPPRWVLGAAIGAGVALLAMLVYRLIARRRVPVASAALAASLNGGAAIGGTSTKQAESDRDASRAELKARGDREIRAAREAFNRRRDIILRRQQKKSPRLKDLHTARLTSLERSRDSEQASLQAAGRAALDAAAARREAARAEAAARHASRLATFAAVERAERERIASAWTGGIAKAYEEAGALRDESAAHYPDWPDPSIGARTTGGAAPSIVRFGRLDIDAGAMPGGLPVDAALQPPGPRVFQLPAAIDLTDRGSLLIHAPAEARDAALHAIRAVMLRLLTALPPGKVRFTIIDPVGLGQNFAGFMHLADHDELMISGKIWTEPRHIEQKLTDLTEHMEDVIQKYLRNQYETIQDYNCDAGEVAEPFRFLVVADFPANITEAAAKRLASIIASGPRCGVFTLIASDARSRPPAGLTWSEVEKAAVTLRWKGGRFVWDDEELSRWPLTLDPAPPEDLVTRIAVDAGRASRELGKVQVPFSMVAPPEAAMWSLDSSEELRVPLGRAGAQKLQYLTLGRGTAQHALLAGRTGSGKSTLLHVLVTTMALWYSPDQVEVYLVDFKKGVEFKTYATHSLPHARVIAVESEREFGLSVLRRLDAELARRGSLFRDAGVQDLAGFRKHLAGSGKNRPEAHAAGPASMPRTLLIVDEFQEFFVEDDRLAQEASLLLDRLVRQGRAFGMHVVLGSQTLGGAYSIARTTIGQMAVRIALQCSEADSYLILSEDNAAARLLSRPGEAIYNDASGLVEGNSPFQIVWLADDTRDTMLERVATAQERSDRPAPPAPIVFEGNIPADLGRNAPLAALTAAGAVRPAVPLAWLGEPISIKEPTAAAFRRQSGSNMLIVGQQDEAALGVAASTILSLAAYHAPEASRNGQATRAGMVILDGMPSDLPHAGFLQGLSRRMPMASKFAGVREAPAALAEVAAELERREKEDDTNAPPVYLVVFAMQRFRDLRKSDDYSFGAKEEAATPSQNFTRIVRDGPALGVHTIAWCDNISNLERSLERGTLREFDTRIAFQMSASDSTHLLDTPMAANVGRHRALLFIEEQGSAEKFRPYAVPAEEWVAGFLGKLGM